MGGAFASVVFDDRKKTQRSRWVRGSRHQLAQVATGRAVRQAEDTTMSRDRAPHPLQARREKRS
jgi:hypothetical protein